MNDHNDSRMNYFVMLSPAEQAAAIRRMASAGMADSTIATATMQSVELIRRVLAASGQCESCE
jgi:hypothetical protein